MARKWLNKPDTTWQPLLGEYPQVLLDTHPSNEFIAMQVTAWIQVERERAAIWNSKTRKIVWSLDNANTICWLPKGNGILILVESFKPDPHKRGIAVTPFQSEIAHFFEQRSWPDLTLISRCQVKPPTGWIIDVVAVPSGQLACYVWCDQGNAGIEFISIAGPDPYQIKGKGYYGPSNLIQGPVFSQDSRFLAMTYGKRSWWSKNPEIPSRGGRLLVGWVVVGEVERGIYRKIEVKPSTPKGWLPEDPEDNIHNELILCPKFVDQDRVKVVLPGGEEYFYSASTAQQV